MKRSSLSHYSILCLFGLQITQIKCLNVVIDDSVLNSLPGKQADKAKAIVDAIDPNDIERIASQINMAAKQAEDLRKRLQAHVEAHVNQLLSDGQVNGQLQVGAGNGNNAVAVPGQGGAPVPQKLELKIDLPPDLAKLVNNGSSLKFHQTFGRKEDGQLGDLTESQITITNGKNTDVTVVSKGSQPPPPPRDNNKQIDAPPPPATTIQTAKLGSLCPLGTFSETGRATTLHGITGCKPCPEGKTTLKLGSDMCGFVAEVDLLNMFFDLMNGDSWSEEQKNGWTSKLPVCEWSGINCNDKGEINGMAFPIMGLKNGLDIHI